MWRSDHPTLEQTLPAQCVAGVLSVEDAKGLTDLSRAEDIFSFSNAGLL